MKSQKKKNALSLWTFPYRRQYYVTHPWKLMKDIILNVKNMWHRARYGFAYVDVWNFLDWYPRVGAAALEYLALHNCGHPHDYTEEEWHEHLLYMSKRLTRCADSFDILCGKERNEYTNDFNELMRRTRCIKKEANGDIVLSHIEFTPEEEELKNNYFRRVDEIAKADQQYREDTFKWIGEDLPRLWD